MIIVKLSIDFVRQSVTVPIVVSNYVEVQSPAESYLFDFRSTVLRATSLFFSTPCPVKIFIDR